VHCCIQQVNRLYKQSDYISYNILRLSTYFGVGRVVQSLVSCVVFCVLFPGLYSVVRVAQSLVFCVVFCVVYPGFLVWFLLPNL